MVRLHHAPYEEPILLLKMVKREIYLSPSQSLQNRNPAGSDKDAVHFLCIFVK